MTNLETGIAEALNDKNAKPSAFSDLLIEIHDALPLNAKALEAAQVRMVAPGNLYPDQAKKTVETITLERQRLEAALPILQKCCAQAERRKTFAAALPRYNELVTKHNQCSETLLTLYHDFCEQVVPLLDSTVKLNSEIRRMNADVHAKGLTEFKTIPTIAEHLIEKLVLPSGMV